MKNILSALADQFNPAPAPRRRGAAKPPVIVQVQLLEQRVLLSSTVTGPITVDTHWTAANGPYILQTDVAIINGATLTIDDGVQVQAINSSLTLSVGNGSQAGTLNATASTLGSISFSTNVNVTSTGTATFVDNTFTSGQLLISQGSSVTLTNNSFHGGTDQASAPIWIPPSQTSLLDGNTFATGTMIGIRTGSITGSAVTWKKLTNVDGYLLIDTAASSGSGDGIVTVGSSGTLTIEAGNQITYQTFGGIAQGTINVASGGTLNSTAVFLNAFVTYGVGSAGNLLQNTFNSNATLTIDASAVLLVRDNTFLGTGTSTVVGTGDNTKTINLTGNFWGTTDVPTIESRIQDKDDLVSRPQINVGAPVAPNTLSGTVWQDVNGNGINDFGESGKSGVTVRLFDAGGNAAVGGGDDTQFGVDQLTDAEGHYAFTGLVPAHRYYVQVVAPANFNFTTPNQGNDAVDSDVVSGGNTAVTDPWGSGAFDSRWDAGLIAIPVDVAPTIGALGDAVTYTGGGPAVLLTSKATVTDTDTPILNGGVLTISLTANAEAADRLEIRSVTRLIGVSGSNVTYRGATIGSFSGGNGANPLVITLNGNATLSATQDLLRNITFRSVSATPSTAARTVQASLTDGAGGTSNSASKTINIVAAGPAFATGPAATHPVTVGSAAAVPVASPVVTIDRDAVGSAATKPAASVKGTLAASAPYAGILLDTSPSVTPPFDVETATRVALTQWTLSNPEIPQTAPIPGSDTSNGRSGLSQSTFEAIHFPGIDSIGIQNGLSDWQLAGGLQDSLTGHATDDAFTDNDFWV